MSCPECEKWVDKYNQAMKQRDNARKIALDQAKEIVKKFSATFSDSIIFSINEMDS